MSTSLFLFLTVRVGNTACTMRRDRTQPDRWILTCSDTLRIRTGTELEIWNDLREFAHTGKLPHTPRALAEKENSQR
jgi:hypothetical protein